MRGGDGGALPHSRDCAAGMTKLRLVLILAEVGGRDMERKYEELTLFVPFHRSSQQRRFLGVRLSRTDGP